MKTSLRHCLHIECLEAREVPSTNPITETFDTTAPPLVPTGWNRWTSDSNAGFQTADGQGVGGSVGLTSSGGSSTSALSWLGQQVGADDGAAVTLWADSLIRSFVFTRGTNLGTQSQSYLAAVVTRGLNVELWQVTGSTIQVLGWTSSPNSAYLSGRWVRISLLPTGNNVSVQVTRADTGQFLNANGTWQSSPTSAITAVTTLNPAFGHAGVGRAAAYSGTARLDSFTILPSAQSPAAPTPTTTTVSQSFDTTVAGATPSGWQTWSGGAAGGFGTTGTRALSPSNGFASSGGSSTSSRAWSTASLPTDVDASAAVYLDSMIPARVFVRGANLTGTAPTYYGVTVTRGLNINIVRVVNGVETVIAGMKSADYVSSQWVRVRLVAEGNRLRAVVYRPDRGQWLTPGGSWSDVPDIALEVNDSAIPAAGFAGLARPAAYSGTVIYDDFEAKAAGLNSGPVVTVTPLNGNSPFRGDVTFRASATGNPNRVEFRLNNVLQAVSAISPATWTLDTTTLTNGTYTLSVRVFDAAGNMGSAEYTFSTSNPNATPLPIPSIPHHYSHIRIASLAYSGNPMGTYEQNLLRNSIDLVVPNPRFFSTIQSVAPDTPQMIYSNVSNLYQGLLTDWLSYADRTGAGRELAFYHVTAATPFNGNSPSSQPVNWFWAVYQTSATGTVTDATANARGARSTSVNFGASGTSTAIGYTDKYRELNVTLDSERLSGWSGVWEYVAAVDATGKPTLWKTLTTTTDSTNGMQQSGQITFDPPSDWVTAGIGGSDRLFYTRLRTTTGTAGQAPVLKTVFGRDYVGANGTDSGIIPAFDYTADKDNDGYLNDTEYATRKAGMDARFVYESRLFYPYYGQMRFVTNPSSAAMRHWAADYHVRVLNANPLADGIFMDNATGKVPFPGVSVLEPTATFSTDSGNLMAAVSRAIAPKWVLANTAGGGANANAIAAGAVGVFEEFAIRPLEANWSEVGDLANLVTQRLSAGARYLVIDSHPGGGSPTDARTQLATLAYYYLLADPERTFLMFYGGWNPSSSWTEHWSQAATVDVGAPTGGMAMFATGKDPSNTARTYQVLSRQYANGMVLYKPLSYANGAGEGTTGSNTTTVHQLGGSYRAVNADGTLGPVITSISLMNGQGAILIKA